jgi:hypothetical protein
MALAATYYHPALRDKSKLDATQAPGGPQID